MLITADFGIPNTGASVFYTLLNPDKTVAQARTSTGVTELVAGSGSYGVEVSDSVLLGKTAVWDINGTAKVATETFPNWPALTRTELATELARIDVATSTRLATSGYTTPPTASANATAVRTELATELARIDVATSTRLASASYTAPANSDITAIKAKTDNLPAVPAAQSDIPTAAQNATAVRTELSTELGRIDVATSTRLAASAYSSAPSASDNAAAVLAAAVATPILADIRKVNDYVVTGQGTNASPWGPV